MSDKDRQRKSDRAEADWIDYCRSNPDDYVEKSSPKYQAEMDRQRREVEKNPLYGLY